MTKKTKVSDLGGTYLDYWVSRALGNHHDFIDEMEQIPGYSTNWEDGGPLIQQFQIDLQFGTGYCDAVLYRPDYTVIVYTSNISPLVAAMRALVASRLGDEVGHD